MDKRSKLIILAILLIAVIVIPLKLISPQFQGSWDKEKEGGYKRTSINIYKNTPVYELALAVKAQNTNKIEKISKQNPELLNYQDPKYGITLLTWAVGMEKYKSAETLLKSGANPDLANTRGETPLFIAAGYSWIDREAKKDPKYVKLLLSYDANPNLNYIQGDEYDNITKTGTSPLMKSIGCGIEKTKALVEGGAEINHKTPSGETAAIVALMVGGPNATLAGMEYAKYLIVEKKAKVSEPYSGKHPVDILRDWVYPLDSEEYKIKMEIVKEFSNQGVNYWDTKANDYTIMQIKKAYPDSWEEYLKRY
ncbi:ankyrin repeat domain-containing protein [Paenibacillus alvei]|uniref:ankyrin repeat domain-containing protein n=1 Tax=Paenibacillus alvei TaxID=44250 RepID=UPI0018CE9F23|nr:ankyrin repeat domain-containing protein [Paenibacillus alvei]MBG9734184.1 ankyrin [Paenibacillus alvei]MBG9744549.1 ankyrin [Paenibacillus alvei]MCY9581742.1 ankyrin repeat domain-containing protein [Paenibacillus alvei]MCY9588351.1 ankyrin repeat domain-containing protein [Paenibacillus alvei]